MTLFLIAGQKKKNF